MKRFFNLVSVATMGAAMLSAGAVSASGNDHSPWTPVQSPNIYSNYLQPVATAIDYHTRMLYLFNYENDKLITVDPQSIPAWPGNVPLQHTVIMPEAEPDLYNVRQHGGTCFLHHRPERQSDQLGCRRGFADRGFGVASRCPEYAFGIAVRTVGPIPSRRSPTGESAGERRFMVPRYCPISIISISRNSPRTGCAWSITS